MRENAEKNNSEYGHFSRSVLNKSKQNHLGQPNLKHLNDSGKFRKITKPFFPDKGMNSNKMMIPLLLILLLLLLLL